MSAKRRIGALVAAVAVLAGGSFAGAQALTSPTDSATDPASAGQAASSDQLTAVGAALLDADISHPGVYLDSTQLSASAMRIRFKAKAPGASEFRAKVQAAAGKVALTWVAMPFSNTDWLAMGEQVLAAAKERGLDVKGGEFDAAKNIYRVYVTPLAAGALPSPTSAQLGDLAVQVIYQAAQPGDGPQKG